LRVRPETTLSRMDYFARLCLIYKYLTWPERPNWQGQTLLLFCFLTSDKKYFLTLPLTVNVKRNLGSIVEKILRLAGNIC
jgi:hypothetical protein